MYWKLSLLNQLHLNFLEIRLVMPFLIFVHISLQNWSERWRLIDNDLVLERLSEGQAFIYNRENSEGGGEPVIYCYLIERCMLDVMQGVDTVCPVHGSVSPQHMLDAQGASHPYFIAPDVVCCHFHI